MKNINTITRNIENNKEIIKYINSNEYYNIDRFIADAKRYIKATKDGRMINSIGSVSASGMSRNIKFLSCEKYKHGFNYENYFSFFCSMGYKPTNQRSHCFKIHGCGMDMIFHTNYSIIRTLFYLGFISKKECATLEQKTPNTI